MQQDEFTSKTIVHANNKVFENISCYFILFFILFIFCLLIAQIDIFCVQSSYYFLAFYVLLDLSLLTFLAFFFIYALNHGPTLLNFYHTRINPQIRDGTWKEDPMQKAYFYKKFKPYINVVIRLQMTMNILALISIVFLLAAFILLDVFLSLPNNIQLNNSFIIFCILTVITTFLIALFYHIFKWEIRHRYENNFWNYSILYSFLLSNLNRHLLRLDKLEPDLSKINEFYFYIKKKFSNEERKNKKNLDKKFDTLKNWTKIWISPLLVLLWSLFIVFIPTLTLWYVGIEHSSLSYNLDLAFVFVILIIVVFYYYVSVCLFYFFIFNNFQIAKNEDETEAKQEIRKITFKLLDPDTEKDMDNSLSKTKLFFMLGILKKIFQNYDFSENDKHNEYEINIEDKLFDLTKFDKDYIKLYGEKKPKNKLILDVVFTNERNFVVKFKFCQDDKLTNQQ